MENFFGGWQQVEQAAELVRAWAPWPWLAGGGGGGPLAAGETVVALAATLLSLAVSLVILLVRRRRRAAAQRLRSAREAPVSAEWLRRARDPPPAADNERNRNAGAPKLPMLPWPWDVSDDSLFGVEKKKTLRKNPKAKASCEPHVLAVSDRVTAAARQALADLAGPEEGEAASGRDGAEERLNHALAVLLALVNRSHIRCSAFQPKAWVLKGLPSAWRKKVCADETTVLLLEVLVQCSSTARALEAGSIAAKLLSARLMLDQEFIAPSAHLIRRKETWHAFSCAALAFECSRDAAATGGRGREQGFQSLCWKVLDVQLFAQITSYVPEDQRAAMLASFFAAFEKVPESHVTDALGLVADFVVDRFSRRPNHHKDYNAPLTMVDQWADFAVGVCNRYLADAKSPAPLRSAVGRISCLGNPIFLDALLRAASTCELPVEERVRSIEGVRALIVKPQPLERASSAEVDAALRRAAETAVVVLSEPDPTHLCSVHSLALLGSVAGRIESTTAGTDPQRSVLSSLAPFLQSLGPQDYLSAASSTSCRTLQRLVDPALRPECAQFLRDVMHASLALAVACSSADDTQAAVSAVVQLFTERSTDECARFPWRVRFEAAACLQYLVVLFDSGDPALAAATRAGLDDRSRGRGADDSSSGSAGDGDGADSPDLTQARLKAGELSLSEAVPSDGDIPHSVLFALARRLAESGRSPMQNRSGPCCARHASELVLNVRVEVHDNFVFGLWNSLLDAILGPSGTNSFVAPPSVLRLAEQMRSTDGMLEAAVLPLTFSALLRAYPLDEKLFAACGGVETAHRRIFESTSDDVKMWVDVVAASGSGSRVAELVALLTTPIMGDDTRRDSHLLEHSVKAQALSKRVRRLICHALLAVCEYPGGVEAVLSGHGLVAACRVVRACSALENDCKPTSCMRAAARLVAVLCGHAFAESVDQKVEHPAFKDCYMAAWTVFESCGCESRKALGLRGGFFMMWTTSMEMTEGLNDLLESVIAAGLAGLAYIRVKDDGFRRSDSRRNLLSSGGCDALWAALNHSRREKVRLGAAQFLRALVQDSQDEGEDVPDVFADNAIEWAKLLDRISPPADDDGEQGSGSGDCGGAGKGQGGDNPASSSVALGLLLPVAVRHKRLGEEVAALEAPVGQVLISSLIRRVIVAWRVVVTPILEEVSAVRARRLRVAQTQKHKRKIKMYA